MRVCEVRNEITAPWRRQWAALNLILLPLWLGILCYGTRCLLEDSRALHSQQNKAGLAQCLPWPSAEDASLVCASEFACIFWVYRVQLWFLCGTSSCQDLGYLQCCGFCVPMFMEGGLEWAQFLSEINAPVQAELGSLSALVIYFLCLIHTLFICLSLHAAMR